MNVVIVQIEGKGSRQLLGVPREVVSDSPER